MIEHLTPVYRFVCDRCGKEQKFTYDEELHAHKIAFEYVPAAHTLKAPRGKAGHVCDACFEDFCELAESFFDELNKEENNDT